MTKAGLDPSRVVERAQLLAKVRGAGKRKRDEDEDMSMDGGEGGEEQDWMDVDDDDGEDSPRKRRKGTNGKAQVVLHNRRAPKTDRTTLGMRDATVCLLTQPPIVLVYLLFA